LPTQLAYIRRVGRDLDHQVWPIVFNGGIVAPSDYAVHPTLGEEMKDEFSKRSATGPWQGTSRGQGAPASAGTPSTATQIERASLPARYEAELDGVLAAYPGARAWKDDEGMWLLTRSEVVPNLARAATFLTALSFKHSMVRAWGFWVTSAVSVEWIGPRHTNLPDGSVCAFAPNEGTWSFGESLVQLLDLYTVWAFRHLHLALLGHWPGPQVAFHPYERLLEFGMGEDCGCGSGFVYGRCCFPKDRSRPRLRDAINFAVQFAGGDRCPSRDVVQTALQYCPPPPLSGMPWHAPS
jgi:hypothetical protein